MYCKNCGAPNAEGAVFCTSCGASLQTDAPKQPVQAPPPAPQAPLYTPPPDYPQAATPPGYPPQAYPPQQQAYPPQQPAYPYPPQPPAPKKKKTGLIIGLSVAAVVILAVVLILVLGGGGGKSGISGKWTVVDTEGWSDYEEGVIFNFKSNGKLVFEAPAGTPDELKDLYEMMNLFKTEYTVSGDKIVLSMEIFGAKDESEMRFTLEGDTLTLYDGRDVTILRRSK